jgi:hypothetical protein
MRADRSIRQADHAGIAIILFDEGTTHRIGHSGSKEGVYRQWWCTKASPIDEAQDSTSRRLTRQGTILLADLATVWSKLVPAEQPRITQLLVERVDVQTDALEVADQGGVPRQLSRRAATAGRKDGGMTQGIETRLKGETIVV